MYDPGSDQSDFSLATRLLLLLLWPKSSVNLFGDRGETEKLKLDGRFGEPNCNLRDLQGIGCDMYENNEPVDDDDAVDEGDGVAVVHGLNGLSGVDEYELDGLL